MDRTGQSWTPKETGLLIKFFQSGNDIQDISKTMGRPPDAILHRLIKLGILGFQETSNPQRSGEIWQQREINELKKEFNSGISIEVIATKHKRDKNAVLHKLIELRIFDLNDRNILRKFSDKVYSEGPSSVSTEYDPYKILGVKRSATKQEIRDRYMHLIKAYHPDMANSKEAKMVFEEKIKEINGAYADINKRNI